MRCVECGGVIGQWEIGDIPFQEHRKFFPNCPIVSQNEFSNEEIGIQPVRAAKYPDFASLGSRNITFDRWNSTAQSSTRLAQAGFYYLGNADEVSEKHFLILRYIDSFTHIMLLLLLSLLIFVRSINYRFAVFIVMVAYEIGSKMTTLGKYSRI